MEKRPVSLDELKIRNAVAHARFLVAIVARSEPELVEKRLAGGWSIKDVLGHLGWWDHWLVYTLYPEDEAIAANPPPMINEIRERKLTIDAINARIYEYNKDRDLAEIRRSFAVAHGASAKVGAKLTEADVFDVNDRSAAIGRSVEELVFGIYEHYEEHAHEIERAYA